MSKGLKQGAMLLFEEEHFRQRKDKDGKAEAHLSDVFENEARMTGGERMRKGERGWKGEVWGGQNLWGPREGPSFLL